MTDTEPLPSAASGALESSAARTIVVAVARRHRRWTMAVCPSAEIETPGYEARRRGDARVAPQLRSTSATTASNCRIVGGQAVGADDDHQRAAREAAELAVDDVPARRPTPSRSRASRRPRAPARRGVRRRPSRSRSRPRRGRPRGSGSRSSARVARPARRRRSSLGSARTRPMGRAGVSEGREFMIHNYTTVNG